MHVYDIAYQLEQGNLVKVLRRISSALPGKVFQAKLVISERWSAIGNNFY